ncbi:MAG: hypothetical protein ACREP9_05240 [Candidatus Dormibacteraceae bacterium]
MIKSLRMDSTMLDRVKRAATIKKMTVSEFMRDAIDVRSKEALEDEQASFHELARHFILPARSENGVRAADINIGDLIEAKHNRIVEKYRQRSGPKRETTSN